MLSFMELRKFTQHPQLLPGIAEDPQNIGSNMLFTALTPTPESHTLLIPTTNVKPKSVKVVLEGVPSALKASITALSGVAIVDREGDLTVHQSGAQTQLLGPAGDPILTTVPSDPNLIKRIAAQAWLNRVLPAGSDSVPLRAETNPASRGNTLHPV